MDSDCTPVEEGQSHQVEACRMLGRAGYDQLVVAAHKDWLVWGLPMREEHMGLQIEWEERKTLGLAVRMELVCWMRTCLVAQDILSGSSWACWGCCWRSAKLLLRRQASSLWLAVCGFAQHQLQGTH